MVPVIMMVFFLNRFCDMGNEYYFVLLKIMLCPLAAHSSAVSGAQNNKFCSAWFRVQYKRHKSAISETQDHIFLRFNTYFAILNYFKHKNLSFRGTLFIAQFYMISGTKTYFQIYTIQCTILPLFEAQFAII